MSDVQIAMTIAGSFCSVLGIGMLVIVWMTI